MILIMISNDCNKILGEVTKFGEKQVKTFRSGEQIYGRVGTMCPPPLGFIALVKSRGGGCIPRYLRP